MQPKYKRVLLKLSGESLAGKETHGIDFDTVLRICRPIKECVDMGVQIAIVVGGGNFWRGRSSGQMDRTRADHMGMLATTINALGVADALEQLGFDCAGTDRDLHAANRRAGKHPEPCSPPSGKRACRAFGCGTGNPFSTDTAASLRRRKNHVDIILKATMVDGVYDSDPKKNPNAVKYDTLSFMDVLNKNLQVMDSTAATMCKDNNIPILVFSIDQPANITKAICGDPIGTIVKEEEH